MQEQLDQLRHELNEIKKRNLAVEADKAWETSGFRVGLLTLTTYVIAAIVMAVIHVDRPWVGALIPALGFFLSTQSLPVAKRWWIKQRK